MCMKFCGFISKYQELKRNFPYSIIARDSQSTAIRFHENLVDFGIHFCPSLEQKQNLSYIFTKKICANPKTSFLFRNYQKRCPEPQKRENIAQIFKPLSYVVFTHRYLQRQMPLCQQKEETAAFPRPSPFSCSCEAPCPLQQGIRPCLLSGCGSGNHRIIEHSEVEQTFKDHPVQLPALHMTSPGVTPCV